jgi:hypothetical protein
MKTAIAHKELSAAIPAALKIIPGRLDLILTNCSKFCSYAGSIIFKQSNFGFAVSK